MKIIFATDLHGDAQLYERLFKEAEKKEIDAVVLGGDITPFSGFDVIRLQRTFLKEYLIPRLERFNIKFNKPVFVMMGNDDFSVNMDILEKADADGIVKLVNNKVLEIGSFQIAGYSFIGPTPFMIKDWEKTEDEIASDLRKLASKSNLRRTVFVFHAPPAETKLDMLYTGSHAGSSAVLGFIKRKQPLLTLHGHIHESPEMSGDWKQKIGRTLSINPGNNAFALVDLEKLDESTIINF